MSKRKRINKEKLKWTLIIFLGIIAMVANIIIHSSALNLNKTYFATVINKQINIADKKFKEGKVNVEKAKSKLLVKNKDSGKGKNIEKDKDSKKDRDLQIIREEVQKSKQVIVEKEKGETEEIKKQTIRINGKQPQDKTSINGDSLSKIQEELGAAYSQVDTPKEQQIISIMQLAVNKLKADKNYDASLDQVEVKAIYNNLDEDSKNRFKFVIFSNVDGESIKVLKSSFGL